MSIQTYQKNLSTTGAPLQTEFRAFAHVIHGLRAAGGAPGQARTRALHDNHRLWTVLVCDLLSDGNHLPLDLKAQLIGIGQWACRYSLEAMSSDASLDPLITVNTNIAQGLSEQMSHQADRMPMAAAG
jgi:flagellar protein FlaF